MPRHWSRKRDMNKFNKRRGPCRKQTFKGRRLLEDLQAEEYLRFVYKKPRNAGKESENSCFQLESLRRVLPKRALYERKINY